MWLSHMQRARLLDLWTVALSADSTAQLDIRRFVAEPSPAWDVEMAAEMWWRASALEALQASCWLSTCPHRPVGGRGLLSDLTVHI